jgi:hypothetical protein
MVFFRFPFWFNKRISFWKLMGSGKNGTFDKRPDWQQWGILAVHGSAFTVQQVEHIDSGNNYITQQLYGAFIANWIKLFRCETWTIFLEPAEGHGTWDGKKVFGALPGKTDQAGPVAILTRATIRVSRLKEFWRNVDPVSSQMAGAEGFLFSLGIGEIPWVKQATFSVWKSREDMKNFAYGMKIHAEVIQKTRYRKWYSEDMFTRFRIISTLGTIRGINPLAGKL